jgi:hypothetical protein
VARITAPLALLSTFLRAARCSVAPALHRPLPKALRVALPMSKGGEVNQLRYAAASASRSSAPGCEAASRPTACAMASSVSSVI